MPQKLTTVTFKVIIWLELLSRLITFGMYGLLAQVLVLSGGLGLLLLPFVLPVSLSRIGPACGLIHFICSGLLFLPAAGYSSRGAFKPDSDARYRTRSGSLFRSEPGE